MELIRQLIPLVVPAALVLYGMYITVKSLMAKEYKQLLLNTKNKYTEVTLPLRLQAYERMALFLERIEISNLLGRTNYHNLSILEVQQVLLEEIRNEYNHNLSQQIYLSSDLWVRIMQAKEHTISLINHTAAEVQKEEKADLNLYIENLLTTNLKDEVVFQTLKVLKDEVQVLF